MASDRFGFPVCELSLVLLKKTWSGDGVGFYLEGGDSIDSSPKHSKELNHGWMDGWKMDGKVDDNTWMWIMGGWMDETLSSNGNNLEKNRTKKSFYLTQWIGRTDR
jgi:hypothetical protein